MVVNWKIVGTAGCALLLSGVLIGFLEPGAPSRSEIGVMSAYVGGLLGLFLLYSLAFAWIGYRQRHRPIIHAVLAYLLASTLAVSIVTFLDFALSLPSTEPQPLVLQAVDWVVAMMSAGFGLFVGRSLANRSLQDRARHDA